MISVEELQAALNDPASPMREKLLQHLSMSPLDPAKAYQQIMQTESPQAGGVPMGGQAPAEPPMDFTNMLGGAQPPQDLSRENNPMGTVNLANSAQVMPTAEGLMPGESGGMPTQRPSIDGFKAMLSGMPNNGQGNRQPVAPNPPAVAPKGNQWNPLNVTQLQTPAVQRQPTLAELLRGR